MMKKTLLIAILAMAFFSCNNDKDQEQALLKEVITTHDELMTDDGIIMQNKTKLKAITVKDTSAATKDSVANYTKTLNNADDAMMNWMNKFNPVFTNKTHEQIISYLDAQKTQITGLDSAMRTAITASNQYLKTKVK